jgi:hypothetical protein
MVSLAFFVDNPSECLEIWEPQPPGTLSRPAMGLLYIICIIEGKIKGEMEVTR